MASLLTALAPLLAAPLHGRLPEPDAGAGGFSGAFHGGPVSLLWLAVAVITVVGVIVSLSRPQWR